MICSLLFENLNRDLNTIMLEETLCYKLQTTMCDLDSSKYLSN